MFFKNYYCLRPYLMAFLLLPVLSIQASGQIWTKIYWYTSGQKPDQGKSVIETTDSSLLVAGGYIGHLVKIDRSGDILWRKSFPEIDQANDLTLTSDSGICLIGSNGTTGKTWLIRTNASGEKQWAKSLDENSGVSAILRNKDNGFAILINGSLLLANNQGDVVKKTNLGTLSTRFAQLPGGQYVIAPNGGEVMLLLDENGNKIWEKSLPGARSVAVTPDGHFAILGYSDIDAVIFLAKWDLTGNELWRKTYPQLDARPFQLLWNKVVSNSQGEIAFIAYVDGTSAFIAKTDNEGSLLCARTQQLKGLSVTLENMTATADKGFAIVGTSGSDNASDMFLMKTDSLCQTEELEIIQITDGNVDTVFAKKFSFKYTPNPCSDQVIFEIQPTEPFDGKMTLDFYDAWDVK